MIYISRTAVVAVALVLLALLWRCEHPPKAEARPVPEERGESEQRPNKVAGSIGRLQRASGF